MRYRAILAAGAIALAAFFILKGRFHGAEFVTRSERARETAQSVSPHPQASPTISPEQALATFRSKTWSPETTAKVRMLEEILSARNDNDPRLDSELRKLSDEDRQALRERYLAMRRESFNERGTVVFLVGRNLETAKDFEFLNEVVTESTCLSLADCGKPSAITPGDESHREAGADVTLAYPQLVALQSIDRLLEGTPNLSSEKREEARRVIQSARASGAPIVAKFAEKLAQKYGF